MNTENAPVHVAVAAIVNDNNEVLLSQRHRDTHLGGLWEFPGGKMEPGETLEQALLRECREELAITPKRYRPLIQITHHYPEKSVLLDVCRVESWSGKITAAENQPLRWLHVNELDHRELPPADTGIMRALQLPELYMITGAFADAGEFEQRLQAALNGGIRLVQLRLKQDWIDHAGHAMAEGVISTAKTLCARSGARLLFNVPAAFNVAGRHHGIHLDSARLMQTAQRPPCALLAASCHGPQQLEKAAQLDADFIVLSPVQATASHPDTEPLGWDRFSAMIRQVNRPVYALGGVGRSDVETAWRTGGQGVAAISALWSSQ